jgi:hypothetical protein
LTASEYHARLSPETIGAMQQVHLRLEPLVLHVPPRMDTNRRECEAWQDANASDLSSDNPADAFVMKLNPMPEPPLTIVESGDALLIAWPSHFTGFELEWDLPNTEPPDWQPAVARPLVVADHFVVVQDAVDPTPLYRLVPQPSPAAPIQGRVAPSGPLQVTIGSGVWNSSICAVKAVNRRD